MNGVQVEICRSALKPIFVTPTLRSTLQPPVPRSAPVPAFSGMSAHHSSPAYPDFCLLCSISTLHTLFLAGIDGLFGTNGLYHAMVVSKWVCIIWVREDIKYKQETERYLQSGLRGAP